MTTTTIKVENKTFRTITLSLQLIAIAMYFIVPLLIGSSVGLLWLILGVLHTVMFAVVFFRNARTRTAISTVFMILVILWCLFLLISMGVVLLFEVMGFGPMSSSVAFLIYFLTSLLAIIFALAGPRRFSAPVDGTVMPQPEATWGQGS